MIPGRIINVDEWPAIEGDLILRGYRCRIEDGNVCLVEDPSQVWRVAGIPRPIPPGAVATAEADVAQTIQDWYGRQVERDQIEGEA